MQSFIPVKITDRIWAERLLKGEMFMRSLSEFGIWDKESPVKDDNRKDIFEGAVSTYGNPEYSPVLKGVAPSFKRIVKNVTEIDETDLKYFKVFCMYCLQHDEETGELVRPDPRVKGFGDSAVVFRDFNEFLLRFGKAIIKLCDNSVELIDTITYFNLDENRPLRPLFEKTSSFSYQNELRLAFAQTVKVDDSYRVLIIKNNLLLNVGDIHDIAYLIPMEELLDTSGIVGPFVDFSSQNPSKPSLYDWMVEQTQRQMKEYKAFFTRPLIIIG